MNNKGLAACGILVIVAVFVAIFSASVLTNPSAPLEEVETLPQKLFKIENVTIYPVHVTSSDWRSGIMVRVSNDVFLDLIKEFNASIIYSETVGVAKYWLFHESIAYYTKY